MSPADKHRTGLSLFLTLLVLNFLWAPVNLMVRFARGFGFSSAGIGLVRWSGITLGLFLLLTIPWFRKISGSQPTSWKIRFVAIGLGLLFIGPAHLLYYITLSNVPTAEGAVYNTTAPIYVALMAGWVLRERVYGRTWIALAIGSVGAYIVSVGFGLPNFHEHGHLGYSLLYILGIFLETVGGTLSIALVRRSSGITVLAWESIGTALAALVGTVLFTSTLPLTFAHQPWQWAPVLYLIVMSGILAFGGWYILAERSPISLMAVSIAIQPPLAAVLGFFVLHEPISTNLLVGSLLVTGALLLAALEPEQKVAEATVS